MSGQGNVQVSKFIASLTERQRLILMAVFEFRYLSTAQFTRLLFGGTDTSEATASRLARRELARLRENGGLIQLEHRAGYRRESNRAHVYGIGPLGRRALEAMSGQGIPRGRTYQEPGGPFVEHTLAVSEVHVRIKEAERHGIFTVERFAGEPGAWRSYTGPQGTTAHLKPDAFLIASQGEFEDRWFIEVDLATERRGALERKLGVYLSYFRSGIEQATTGVFPRVIWMVPDPARRQFMEDIIEKLGAPEGLFTVTETSHAIETLAGGEDRHG